MKQPRTPRRFAPPRPPSFLVTRYSLFLLLLVGCGGENRVGGAEDSAAPRIDLLPLADLAVTDVLTDASDTPSTDTAPEPTDTAPELTDMAPEPTDTAPELTDAAPELTDTAPEPTDTTPELTDSLADPDAGEAVALDVTPEVTTDTTAPSGPKAVPRLSATVVRTAQYEEPLLVACETVNEFGETVPDPGDYQVQITPGPVEQTPDGYFFAESGTYVVTCTDPVNDLTGSAEVVVAHEMTRPGIATVSGELGQQAALIDAALAAAKTDDAAALADSLDGLADSRATLGAVETALVQVPPGGWPALAQLQQQLDSAPDDTPYADSMAAVQAAADDVLAATQAFQAAPSPQTLGALGATTQTLRSALDQAAALDPGGLGHFQALPHWDAALASMRQAQDLYLGILQQMFANPDAWEADPCPDCFTLTELMISVAIHGILDQIPTYQKLLKDAAKAAASMAVMMAVADAIDATYPPGPDAPEFQYIMGGYGNAVNDGATLSFLGVGFDPFPPNNIVLFIGPEVGDTVVNIVDLALGAMKAFKDLGSWENVFELGGALWGIWDNLQKDLGLLADDIPDLMQNGVVPLPVLSVEPFLEDQDPGVWDQIVALPALPLCNDSWLPKAAILIPISFTRGNGPTFKLVILP